MADDVTCFHRMIDTFAPAAGCAERERANRKGNAETRANDARTHARTGTHLARTHARTHARTTHDTNERREGPLASYPTTG